MFIVVKKRDRTNCSEEGLQLFEQIHWTFVVVSSLGMKHGYPRIKKQSKQGVTSRESALEKTKTVSSTSKVIANCFWNRQRIMFVAYLEKDKTITVAQNMHRYENTWKPGFKKKKRQTRKRFYLVYKKMADGIGISFKLICSYLLCGIWPALLFGKDLQTRAPLQEVHLFFFMIFP